MSTAEILLLLGLGLGELHLNYVVAVNYDNVVYFNVFRVKILLGSDVDFFPFSKFRTVEIAC
jgi:hypothetical protein